MFQYRQVLVRLRAGDTIREIARAGLMGRDKAGELHALALSKGWLESAAQLPDDAQIADALGFCDAHYFSRRFKEITGKSARAFRRELPR